MQATTATALWHGHVSFGLVSIPCGLYAATREHDPQLHLVHARCGARIRHERVCERDGERLEYYDIARGYELPGGRTVVLTDADLAALPLPSRRVVDVLAFVDSGRIDPMTYAKPYYVAPDRAGLRAYVLLRDAMIAAGRIGITKVTLSTRERAAVLRPHGDLLVLQTVLWPDEIVTPTGIAPPADVVSDPQALELGRELVAELSRGYDLARERDEYADALRELLDARLRHAPVPREQPVGRAPAMDLMEALERSVAAKADRT